MSIFLMYEQAIPVFILVVVEVVGAVLDFIGLELQDGLPQSHRLDFVIFFIGHRAINSRLLSEKYRIKSLLSRVDPYRIKHIFKIGIVDKLI